MQEVEEACEGLGITDVAAKPVIRIYPNPATKEIYVFTENKIIIKKINVYNQVGQKVLQEFQTTGKIDVSSLSSGVYIIEFVTNETSVSEMFIIK